jgi:hypothetical protein
MKRFVFSLVCFLLLYGNIISFALGSPKILNVNLFLAIVVLILSLLVFKSFIFSSFIYLIPCVFIIILAKYFFDNGELSGSIIKLLNSFIISILFYLYLKTIDFNDSYYLNYVFILLIITSLIAFSYCHFFPNLTIQTDEFNEPIGYIFSEDDNKYTRDGLFGANVLSYILCVNFILFMKYNVIKKVHVSIRFVFLVSTWLAIVTMESRLAVVVYSILTFYYLSRRSFVLAIIVLTSFLFVAQNFEFSNRFSESSGRAEKWGLYLDELSNNPGNLFFGQSKSRIDEFNNQSEISLSDNSYFEVILGGGIFFFVVFFSVFIVMMFNSFNKLNVTLLLLLSFFFIGLLLTTSIYFVNYIFFFFLSLYFASERNCLSKNIDLFPQNRTDLN